MIYEYIGWCNQDNHDKVWGIIRLHEMVCIIFWGRRGAKLQTKKINLYLWEANELFYKKIKRGYQRVNIDCLNEVYPEFQKDLEKTAIWATLKL